MKKYLAIALALCMVFALCACGAKAPAADAPKADAPKADAPAPAADANAPEKTVLTLWCIATESDANHEGFVKAKELLI